MNQLAGHIEKHERSTDEERPVAILVCVEGNQSFEMLTTAEIAQQFMVGSDVDITITSRST